MFTDHEIKYTIILPPLLSILILLLSRPWRKHYQSSALWPALATLLPWSILYFWLFPGLSLPPASSLDWLAYLPIALLAAFLLAPVPLGAAVLCTTLYLSLLKVTLNGFLPGPLYPSILTATLWAVITVLSLSWAGRRVAGPGVPLVIFIACAAAAVTLMAASSSFKLAYVATLLTASVGPVLALSVFRSRPPFGPGLASAAIFPLVALITCAWGACDLPRHETLMLLALPLAGVAPALIPWLANRRWACAAAQAIIVAALAAAVVVPTVRRELRRAAEDPYSFSGPSSPPFAASSPRGML